MLKIEFVWRELLYRAIEKKDANFSIIELSRQFNLSTSVVSHALNPLRKLNIVEIGKIQSRITDAEKLLYFWATRRNLNKEVIYRTYSPGGIYEIESLMPQEVVPTAYTACRFLYNINPADYAKVYFYSENTKEIKNRFPINNRREANIIIFKSDEFLSNYKVIPMAQVFVDLWILSDWYAKEFSEKLLDKIKGELGI